MGPQRDGSNKSQRLKENNEAEWWQNEETEGDGAAEKVDDDMEGNGWEANGRKRPRGGWSNKGHWKSKPFRQRAVAKFGPADNRA